MDTAIDRSNPGPIFGMSAGDNATVTFNSGKLNPEFLIAARTRSRASRTDESGLPVTANPGRPELTLACTSTTCATKALSPTACVCPNMDTVSPETRVAGDGKPLTQPICG